MLEFAITWIRSLLSDEEGASAIEYGLILGLIAIVLILVLTNIGGGLNTLFGQASSAIATAGS